MASTETTRITSDLQIDVSKFLSAAIDQETVDIKAVLQQITTDDKKWYVVGAAKYRKMRIEGKTPMPPPVFHPAARNITIPSRDQHRDIPVRVFEPSNGMPSQGLILHIHGGGFVMLSHDEFDIDLERYAKACQLTALSVGYRLAPENPYPAGLEDCIDAAQYLIDHGESRFGAKLRFVTGASAGSCIAAATIFALMRSRPSHNLAGFLSHFGWFDVTLGLPYASSYRKPIMTNIEELQHCAAAYTPGATVEERRDPGVSPLYEDFQALAAADAEAGARLPPALFHIGTDDPFLDDNILMSAKWQIAGSEGGLKIYPGQPHGFSVLGGRAAADCHALDIQWVNEKLAALED